MADNPLNEELTSITQSIGFTNRASRTFYSNLLMASTLSSYLQRNLLDVILQFDTPLVLWGILWLKQTN